METLTEKFLAWICCATVLVLGVLTLTLVVAPVLRHLLFAGALWCTHVKAQVEEAYIVGGSRPVAHSRTGPGATLDAGVRDLRFFIVSRYQYGGKTYTTRSYALYNDDVALPGARGGSSDGEFFETAVARLRQVAPNTAYTFLQPDDSKISRDEVKDAMANIPEGIAHAEMDMKILKWAPGWNYYNFPFSDGINWKSVMLLFGFLAICGSLSLLVLRGAIDLFPHPKDFLSHTWPGWALGLLIAFIGYHAEYGINNRPPPEKHIDETVPSSRIHRS